MAAIELHRVSKRYGGTVAVQDASLSIEDGEFFILVGPSGCGKSTLLNMIVGLESVSAGEVRVDGRKVNDLDPRERNMAMVFQSYAIYPHMTVRENLAFPLRMARMAREEIERRVRRAAGILELTDYLDRRPAALSGGQRQRVAMGRAIVREPAAFLLDEPLSNLDAKLRTQMRTEIARLQHRLGTTTVYVTHDQTEAMTLGRRIAVLRRGRVLQIGTPRELYEQPVNLFVAGFIGAPAMNFLPARISNGRLVMPVGEVDLPDELRERASAAGGALIAGFRPEHLRLPGAHDAGDVLHFELRAELVEWLGADLHVHADIDLQGFDAPQLPGDLDLAGGGSARPSLVARIAPDPGVQAGSTLKLALDPARLQLFDAGSGDNLAAHGMPETP
jgi:multiple sugar transport system ATP-binding protein